MKWIWAGLLAALGFMVTGGPTLAADEASAAPKTADTRTVIRHTDPAAAQKLLADGKVAVLDIRTPKEYATGHLDGAKLVDFSAPDFKEKLSELGRNQPYLVHCASGRRSTKALETFRALGFKEIIHLDGGFNAWKADGKPVVR